MIQREVPFIVARGATLLLVTVLVVACGRPSETGSGAVTAADEDAAPSVPSETVATTEYGPVRGAMEDGILAFKGIRYGADTSTTRFAAPAPPAPWDVEAIIAAYRELQPDADPADVYLEATTDARYLTGHVREAERKVEQGGAPVWLYLFNWDTPVDGGKWRSPHALEIGFVFDNVAYSESMSGVGEEQQRVADVMSDTWIAFARNGNPNNPDIPQWPPYNLETRPVMVLDATPEVVNDARGAQRALFDDSDSYLRRYER